jgi:pimeloyl-ACP methyl ester carboxylesterase
MQFLPKSIPCFLYLFIAASLLLSCKMGIHTMSDRQIEKHYKNRLIKPVMKYLSYKEYHILHAVVGDTSKPLLLFIHGSPGAWYSYMKMMDDSLLRANYRMIAVDRIGFDKSNYGPASTSIDEHVTYLEKLVTEYNITGQKVFVMGSSYGGPIAASFAAQNPELVQELFLLSPVIDPASEKIFWFSYMAKLAFINMWLHQSLNVASGEKFTHKKELRRLKPYWKDIRCKTTVVMGEKDWMASHKNFDFAQKMLINANGADFYMLENTGHVILYHNPELVKNLLLHREIK